MKLPAPLSHLANSPHGRYRLSCPVEFTYRGDEVAAQAATGAVRYDIAFDPERGRWYPDGSWRVPPAPAPGLDDLRGHPLLAVDLNHDHLAAWIVTPAGNPAGPPVTIVLQLAGLPASQRDGRIRAAISGPLRTAREHRCAAIAVEDLSFTDAREQGREWHGNRPSRGKRGRGYRLLAGIPTGKFRARLAQMAANAGLAVIGRRAHGHTARRREGVTGGGQRTVTRGAAPTAPAAPGADRNGRPRKAQRQPPRWRKTATADRAPPPDQATHDRPGPPAEQHPPPPSA